MERPPKFVILSGYDDFGYALSAMKQKVAEYVLKPIDEEEFEAILQRVGASIQAESAAQRTENRMHSLFLNNLLNRLIQGEADEGLEQQAARALHVKTDAELRCLLVETDIGSADLRERLQLLFPGAVDLGLFRTMRGGSALSCRRKNVLRIVLRRSGLRYIGI